MSSAFLENDVLMSGNEILQLEALYLCFDGTIKFSAVASFARKFKRIKNSTLFRIVESINNEGQRFRALGYNLVDELITDLEFIDCLFRVIVYQGRQVRLNFRHRASLPHSIENLLSSIGNNHIFQFANGGLLDLLQLKNYYRVEAFANDREPLDTLKILWAFSTTKARSSAQHSAFAYLRLNSELEIIDNVRNFIQNERATNPGGVIGAAPQILHDSLFTFLDLLVNLEELIEVLEQPLNADNLAALIRFRDYFAGIYFPFAGYNCCVDIACFLNMCIVIYQQTLIPFIPINLSLRPHYLLSRTMFLKRYVMSPMHCLLATYLHHTRNPLVPPKEYFDGFGNGTLEIVCQPQPQNNPFGIGMEDFEIPANNAALLHPQTEETQKISSTLRRHFQGHPLIEVAAATLGATKNDVSTLRLLNVDIALRQFLHTAIIVLDTENVYN
jgi:hypothetical protein